MNIKEIVFSKSHLTAPFTVPYKITANQSIPFSTLEKVAFIALSIIIGVFTAGIGGVIVFYLVTAAMKTKYNQPVPEIVPRFPKENSKVSKPSAEADKLNSVVIHASPTHEILSDFQSDLNRTHPTLIRKYPPLSMHDTVIFKDGEIKSAHPEGIFYSDSEILELHPPTQSIDLGNNVNADIIDNGKVVIQQQAKRGCTAAVAAMLIHDAKKPINLDSLSTTNLGNTESIKFRIAEADLTSQVTQLTSKDCMPDELLNSLQKLIQVNGPAIITTDNDIGGHVIVVDAVSNNFNSIRLRDPYHGWAITVTKEAFLRGFKGGDIIQIVS